MTNTRNYKLFFIALSIILLIVMFGFSLYPSALLGRYSKSYNEMIDRRSFKQLKEKMAADNIHHLEVVKRSEDPTYVRRPVDVTDRSAFEMFNSMIYVESAWNMKENTEGTHRIAVFIKIEGGSRAEVAVLTNYGVSQFIIVDNNMRRFIVEIPGLLPLVQSVTDDEDNIGYEDSHDDWE